MRRPEGGARRGGGRGRRRAAAALAALAWTLVSCAGGVPRRRPAPPARAAEIALRWEAFRSATLARAATELFYEARIRRSVLSGTFVAAVRVEPGRTLSVVIEGPLGAPVARARWDGKATVIERSGRGGRSDDAPSTLAELGVPLSARSLSFLLFGLPDDAPPDAIELTGSGAWLSWRGGSVGCEFDDAEGTVGRVISREPGGAVDIRYAGWAAGIPSRIAMRSRGGRADLEARTAEPGP